MTADKHLDRELEVTLRPSVLARLRSVRVRERNQKKPMSVGLTRMTPSIILRMT